MIKMEIRSLTIPSSKNKARNRRNLQNQLESHLQLLKEKINTSTDEKAESELQEYERLKTELRLIYERRADDAISRSKIKWIEKGENLQNTFLIWSEEIIIIKQ